MSTARCCSLFLLLCVSLVLALAAAEGEVRFPYASADGPTRYAGWVPTYTESATRTSSVPLHRITLYLAPRNLALLDEMVWEVSDPDSPRYAKYLTTDDITNIVAPAPEAVKAVVEWLHQEGAVTVEVARNRDAIVAMMPVHKAETAFAVSLRRFVSPDGRRSILRSSQPYAVPARIATYIDLISGLTDFPPVGSGKKSLQTFSAAAVPSPVPGTPIVTMVRARGGDQLIIDFIPVCANGQFTKDANTPCSEAPPAIAGFYAQISSISAAVGKSKSQWVNKQCSFNGNYTTCTATVTGWLFDALNVSVAAAFENDTVGPYGFNPYPVLATPPIVPQSIWKQYNIPPNTLVVNNATQCVVEFEQQYYSPADLNLFLAQTGLPTDTPVTVIGPNYPDQPGGEANLDIQYIMGVAPGAPTVFWSIYANSTVEIDDILQWALQMSNTDNPPQVNSLSYGMSEVNVDKYLGKGYLARADFEFKKLALRGITIIIASGDTGAGDLGEEPMTVPNCDTLHADWPSQSAYVTSVGSTIITPAAEPICYAKGGINCLDNPLGEIVVSVDQGLFWTSGGGFSNISQRATYQASEVEHYLNHKSIPFPAPGAWNPNGRAYPDVAAVGHNLMVALNGKFIPVDGTSASAPIFAGVVTLLNDARAAAGLPPLGFLNPILYKARRERPQTFYDVTWGNNRCGALGFDPVCCPQGYHATDGWDAATGLGTPNFLELKQFVLQYPKKQ